MAEDNEGNTGRKRRIIHWNPDAGKQEERRRWSWPRVAAWTAWLAEALSDGRRFLGGDQAGAVDLAHYHLLWLMRGGERAGSVDRLLGLGPVLGWYGRVAGLGHGRPRTLTAEAALEAARSVEPAPVAGSNAVPESVAAAPDAGENLAPPVEVTFAGNQRAATRVALLLMGLSCLVALTSACRSSLRPMWQTRATASPPRARRRTCG